MIALLVIAAYGIGILAMWYLAARHWIARFGSASDEIVVAGVWGLLVALVWPVVLLGWTVGRLAS